MQRADGLWRLRDPRLAQQVRMNIGTIIDTDTLKVRMKGRSGASAGKPLGEVEESFAASLVPGDTFLMGGNIVRFESLREMEVQVSRDRGRKPKLAVFSGTKFATSTQLSVRILDLLHRPALPNLPSTRWTGSACRRRSATCPVRAASLWKASTMTNAPIPASMALLARTRSKRWA